MNIIKERIKLELAFPKWRKTLKNIENDSRKKIFLIGTPVHGNLGDHAIAIQEKFFFEDYFYEYGFYEIIMPMYYINRKRLGNIINKDDLVVVSGGGWMGNLWIHNENVIREIVCDYPNNKIIILPQTAYYTNDKNGKLELEITQKIFERHNDLQIFLREKKSYELIKCKFKLTGKSNIYLAPDMVLYGKNIAKKKNYTVNKNIINLCIRKDCEALQNDIDEFTRRIMDKYNVKQISTVIDSHISLYNRMSKLCNSWEEFAKGKITITDRLHAMLFSILNGVPCIILDNKTGKVFGVAEWLKNTNMIFKVKNFNEVFDVLEEIKTEKKYIFNEYNRANLINEFDKMANIIREN